MTDRLCVVLCAPDHGAAYSSSDIEQLKSGLTDTLDAADVSLCVVGDGSGLSTELTEIRARHDGPIVCVPMTPFAGDMQKRLIPEVVSRSVGVYLANEAGVDPAMLRAAKSRVEQAISGSSAKISPEDTLLMIVAHGSIDMDANGNLMKMSRMIWEGLGFGWAEVAYVSGAFPSVEQSIERARHLGFGTVVVLPYVILGDDMTSTLSSRIADALGPDDQTSVVVADGLGADENVVRVLAARISEAVAGKATSVMNCQLCTYREQVLAIEAKEHDHHHGHDHHHDD